MKKLICLLFPLLMSVATSAQLNYPQTKTVDASDTYFGKTYPDPYRWLENLQDDEVKDWFRDQSLLTDDFMRVIPGRDRLLQEWSKLGSHNVARENYTSIKFENGRVFYKKFLGFDNVGKIYVRDGWNGKEKVLFNPATYNDVTANIQGFTPSPDGRYVVLGFSSGGTEYSELRILDVGKGTLLPEKIYPSFGAYGWTPDSKGFFYDAGKVSDIRSLAIKLNHKTRLHKLGTDIRKDIDFFSNESNPELGIDPKEFPVAYVMESYPEYIFGRVGTVQTERKIYYAPVSAMKNKKITWDVLCKPSDNLVHGPVFYGDYAYAVTHTNAPKYKVIRTSVKHPDWSNAETVIAEGTKSIRNIIKSRDFLFIVYSDGILSSIVKYDLAAGKSSDIKLPLSGAAEISCIDWHTNQCLLSVSSWTAPTTLYDFDADKDAFKKSIFDSGSSFPEFENLVTEEVELPGYDGTMIPLSIIYRKGIALDGNNSCILDGYGAYGMSRTPYCNMMLNGIALHGVVIAISHPRGGGEKGEAWYKAGYKTTKPNTWKDFISCAEYLVKKGYTSPEKLGGTGTSAGGILISRAITERPDLFTAIVCNVGCANAMRLEFSPNGPVNIPEFGTVKDPVECQALYEMDGVQHVRKGVRYPAVLCVAGWNDPRVAPWQPGKFAAALQNASTSGKPALLKVNYDNGHFTEERSVSGRNFADQYTFLLWQTGHKDFQPRTSF